MNKGLVTHLILILLITIEYGYSQQYVFATLNGSPVMNTSGWNVVGAAAIGDTPGDANSDPDEMILCPAVGNTSGACFFATPLNLNICNGWVAEFDYRMYDGTAADGIAFCFLANPPTGYVTGGGVGIPSNPIGLMVVLDSYDNGCGPNPELQIFQGNGTSNYNECAVTTRLTNVPIIRQPNYNRMKIKYLNGNVSVYINGTFYLSAYVPVNYTGYLGFTASTGASTDNHSIRNVVIYTSQPVSEAGNDAVICSGATIQLGTSPIPGYSYSWTPVTGLNNPAAANPFLTLQNFSPAPMQYTYVVVTDSGNLGCTSTDTVHITVLPHLPLDAGTDTAICSGESVQLQASGGVNYVWSPAVGLNDTTIANPVASPTVTTTYTVTSSISSGNLVVNGDFSMGNSGFNSGYTYATNLQPEGTYWVGPDASNVHPGFTGNDHTTGTGNFLVVNGAGTPGVNVWCQTINVKPNTTYNFSAWVSSVNASNPAILQFSINGVQLGQPFQAPSATGIWQQFNEIWYSGNTTTATICIVNLNTVLSGNDFGIDDIAFETYCEYTDTVRVTVRPRPVATAGNDRFLCRGDTVILHAGGGDAYLWAPAYGLSSDTATRPVASPSVTTTYTLTATNIYGCHDTAEVTVTVWDKPVVGISGLSAAYCLYDPADILSGTPSGGVFSGAVVQGNMFDPSVAGSGTHAVYYSYTDSNGCTAVDTAITEVHALPEPVISGLAVSYCIDASAVVLTGTPSGGVFSGAVVQGNVFDPSVAGSGTHAVYYSYTDSNGCTAVDTAITEVYPLPQLTLDGLSNGYCMDHPPVALNPSPMGGVLTGNGITGNVFNPADASPGMHTITYQYSDSNGCENSISQTVAVWALPELQLTGKDVSCSGGNDGWIRATVTGGLQPYGYQWDGYPAFTGATLYGLPAGNYSLTVSDQNGCTASTSHSISEPPPFEIDIMATDTVIRLGETVSMQAVGSFPAIAQYHWEPSAYLDCPDCPVITASPVHSGYFILNAVNDSGCYSV
ncbi:MAG: hypothetical protein D6706_21945, partial [Chloroflexi bacterium]